MARRRARWISWSALLCLVACERAHEPRPNQPSSNPSGDRVATSVEPPLSASASTTSAERSTGEGAPERSVWDEGTHDTGFFAAICLDTPRLAGASTRSRACLMRGHVLSLTRTVAGPEDGVDEPNVRALKLSINPDDSIPCRTPLDAGEEALREAEADWRDLTRAHEVLLVGAARIESELRRGRAVCGWTKVVARPGLPAGPPRWEGQLSADDGTLDDSLLAAWSAYFVPSRSRMLARRWSFARGGRPTLDPVDEGGALVRHPQLRVRLDDAALTIDASRETEWPAKNVALRAESLLTTGATPVFMGTWDGYRFSAVRARP